MKWDSISNNVIRRKWQVWSDSVLAAQLGTTKDAIRKQRYKLELYRPSSKGFILQITKWIALSGLQYWAEWLRYNGVEYIIARSKGGRFALFRKHVGALPVESEPPRDTWVQHWVFDGKKVPGVGVVP